MATKINYLMPQWCIYIYLISLFYHVLWPIPVPVAPRHYLNWCWLIIHKAPCYLVEILSKFTFSSNENARLEFLFAGSWPSRSRGQWVGTLGHGQNVRHLADNIFKYIFLNEKKRLKFYWNFLGSISKWPALIQVMDWCWTGVKPFLESMMPHGD